MKECIGCGGTGISKDNCCYCGRHRSTEQVPRKAKTQAGVCITRSYTPVYSTLYGGDGPIEYIPGRMDVINSSPAAVQEALAASLSGISNSPQRGELVSLSAAVGRLSSPAGTYLNNEWMMITRHESEKTSTVQNRWTHKIYTVSDAELYDLKGITNELS